MAWVNIQIPSRSAVVGMQQFVGPKGENNGSGSSEISRCRAIIKTTRWEKRSRCALGWSVASSVLARGQFITDEPWMAHFTVQMSRHATRLTACRKPQCRGPQTEPVLTGKKHEKHAANNRNDPRQRLARDRGAGEAHSVPPAAELEQSKARQ